MAYVINSECISCGACEGECTVSAISEGDDTFVIDAELCIDCGACIPECPFEAIFIEEEVPSDFSTNEGQESIPFETKARVKHAAGEVLDLTDDIQYNYEFFASGPGYDALK